MRDNLAARAILAASARLSPQCHRGALKAHDSRKERLDVWGYQREKAASLSYY